MNYDLEPVRRAAEITRIIGGYVSLQKKGSSFWGRCPFHDEKSPSFHVLPDRQVFKCFGCGATGDVFSFVQRFESLTFPQAIRTVAELVGIELDKPTTATDAAQLERARQRQEALALAADCAWFVRQAIRRLHAEASPLRAMCRGWNLWALKNLDHPEEPGWQWEPVICALEDEADRLAAAADAIQDEEPNVLMGAYLRYRKQHPITREEIQARVDDEQNAIDMGAAIIRMLADVRTEQAA